MLWNGNECRKNELLRFSRQPSPLYRRIILRWIFRKWDGGMNWIYQVQDRGRWLALLNAVMNLTVT